MICPWIEGERSGPQSSADGKEKREKKENNKKWNPAADGHIPSAVSEQKTIALIRSFFQN